MRRASAIKFLLARSSLLAALCAIPSTAFASVPSRPATPDAEHLRQAREQFNQALALQTAGDWAGALALLKEVATVKSTPQVRFNIAICEERLGRLVAAIGDYELAAADADGAAQVAREVVGRLAALKARVPRIVVQRGEGADSATISLDGVALGDSILNVPMPTDPGPHVVEARADGFLPFKQAFRVTDGQVTTLLVKLEARPVAPPPVLPPQQVVLPPHRHPSTLRNVGLVVGGVGLAGLAGAGAMYYLRYDTISHLDQQCGTDRQSCPSSAHSDIDRGKLYTTIGDVTLVIGAVSVLTGAALVVVGGHHSEQGSIAIVPGAPSANAGVTIFGCF